MPYSRGLVFQAARLHIRPMSRHEMVAILDEVHPDAVALYCAWFNDPAENASIVPTREIVARLMSWSMRNVDPIRYHRERAARCAR